MLVFVVLAFLFSDASSADDVPGRPGLRAAGQGADHVTGPHDAAAMVSAQRDARWVERIRGGDRAAFADLYTEYLHAMAGFAHRLVQMPSVAEDICAEVFIKIWERRESWRPRYGVRAYLFHAVRTRALNYLRDDATAKRLTGTFAEMAEAQHDIIAIDEQMDAEVVMTAARAAIATFPPMRRRIMELRWQHGLEIEEIAHVMELSRAAVDQHLSRGLRRLRELLPGVLGGLGE